MHHTRGGGACYSGFIPLLCWLYSAAILLLFSCYSPAIPLLFPCYSPAILLLLWLALFQLYCFMPVLCAVLYAVRNARCRQRLSAWWCRSLGGGAALQRIREGAEVFLAAACPATATDAEGSGRFGDRRKLV